MGEGFRPRGPAPSPIIICGKASLPSPAGGEGTITATAACGSALISLLQRRALRLAQRAIDRLGRQRQRGEPHADSVLDRIGDRGRDCKRAAFANALAAEGTGPLLGLDRLVLHVGRNIENA